MAKAKTTAAAMSQHVSHEEFIRVWQTSASVKEVSDKLGGRLRPLSASVRASYLRKKGIALKLMPRGTERLTQDRLAELKALAQKLS